MTPHTCPGLCLCRPLEHLFDWASTVLAGLVPYHRPFPGPQTPHAAHFQTLCAFFLVASVSRTMVGSLTFPVGAHTVLKCFSLMFTFFCQFAFYYSLPQLQCVAQRFNISEVVTFQGVSFLSIDRWNSFSHCLIQHTCHLYHYFISKFLCYLDR